MPAYLDADYRICRIRTILFFPRELGSIRLLVTTLTISASHILVLTIGGESHVVTKLDAFAMAQNAIGPGRQTPRPLTAVIVANYHRSRG